MARQGVRRGPPKALGEHVSARSCSAEPITVEPDDTLEDGRHADARPRRLPPARGRRRGRLVGIIARGDIVRAIVRASRTASVRRHRALRPGTTTRADACGASPGRRRPRRHRPQRRGRWPPASAPAAVCAVVKADGYGHGAVAVARAALTAAPPGWRWPWSRRPRSLREAGIDAPILCCPSPASTSSPPWSRLDLRLTVYTADGHRGRRPPRPPSGPSRCPVHLKVDTGMHRVGCAARRGRGPGPGRSPPRPALRLGGGVDPLRRGRRARATRSPPSSSTASTTVAGRARRRRASRPPMLPRRQLGRGHRPPRARLDLVRGGIAVYGIAPVAGPGRRGSTCARRCALRAEVSMSSGSRPASGSPTACATSSTARTTVATVPIGYADGVPRRLSAGRRRGPDRRAPACPIVGASPWTSSWSTAATTRRWRSATRSCCIGAPGRRGRSPPRSGPSGSTPSATRSSAASARACPASTAAAPSGASSG